MWYLPDCLKVEIVYIRSALVSNTVMYSDLPCSYYRLGLLDLPGLKSIPRNQALCANLWNLHSIYRHYDLLSLLSLSEHIIEIPHMTQRRVTQTSPNASRTEIHSINPVPGFSSLFHLTIVLLFKSQLPGWQHWEPWYQMRTPWSPQSRRYFFDVGLWDDSSFKV